MAYFNLDAWTKDTVNGLNETIFGYLTESGYYLYTASGDNDREFADTGSSIISMQTNFSPNFINISTDSGSSIGNTSTGGGEVEYYLFTSEYPNPVNIDTGVETTGSYESLRINSGSLPFQ